MKKFFMSLVVALAAVSASAQVYVGGNVGISGTKIGGGDRETTYKFLPEIGYQLSPRWAVGLEFGWAKGKPVELSTGLSKTFEINPYARYTALKTKLVDVFFDGTVGYKHYDGEGEAYQFGVVPGLALNLSQKVSLVTKVGFLGYKTYNPNGDAKSSDTFGFNLDGNNLSLGLLVKF